MSPPGNFKACHLRHVIIRHKYINLLNIFQRLMRADKAGNCYSSGDQTHGQKLREIWIVV